MKWFLAKLVYRIICGEGRHTAQFDEQLRLIYAEDELHAFYKARLLGEGDCIKDEIESMVNVQWRFIDVTDLHLLACDADGAEMYSVIREEPDANLYIRNIQQTATRLLQRGLQQFTTLNSNSIGT
jgi:voltage-gated potassium channel Kch